MKNFCNGGSLKFACFLCNSQKKSKKDFSLTFFSLSSFLKIFGNRVKISLHFRTYFSEISFYYSEQAVNLSSTINQSINQYNQSTMIKRLNVFQMIVETWLFVLVAQVLAEQSSSTEVNRLSCSRFHEHCVWDWQCCFSSIHRCNTLWRRCEYKRNVSILNSV